MNEDITAPWASEATVHDMTDTDLQAGKNKTVSVSFVDEPVPAMVATLQREQRLSSVSEVGDRALRIELAWAIDNYEVQFSREDYDIGVLIPPTGWVNNEMSTYDTELVDDHDIDEEGPLHMTTPPVLHEMCVQAVEDDDYPKISAVVIRGLQRQCQRVT
jgi:hypothetical protein